MTVTFTLFVSVLLAGFYMAWSIGANDVANAIGTAVGSGALRLRRAVILAAILEFAGAFFLGSYVSGTIQSGIVDPNVFAATPLVYVNGMLAALIAAGLWLHIASYYGWPVSTTHTIVGAVVGFGAVVGGMDAIYWDRVTQIFTSWIATPLIAGVISFSTFNVLRNQIFYNSAPIQAAQRLTPILVFIILLLLSLVMIFSGLKNLHLQLSSLSASLISLAIAACGSFISWLLLRTIPAVSTKTRGFNPELATALEKARKHLRRVQASCEHELVGKVSDLIEEVEHLQGKYKTEQNRDVVKSEYAVVENIFSYLQIFSVCMMAFAHGANILKNFIPEKKRCV